MTNLGVIYMLKGDLTNAEYYTDQAINMDRYCHRALTNKGNLIYQLGQFPEARDCYLEAIGMSACSEGAIYNLGLTDLRLENYEDALLAFSEVNQIHPQFPDLLWKLGEVNEALGNLETAFDFYSLLTATYEGNREEIPI